MHRYNIWNKWDPLKVCMLGNNYAPEFFNGLDKKISDPLKKICEETLEDLEGYKNILQQFGVTVIQPELDPNERFLDNSVLKNFSKNLPRGPLQPRDYQIVIGNTCFTHNFDHPSIANALTDYNKEHTVSIPDLPLPEYKYNQIACFESGNWPSYNEYASGLPLKEFVKQEIADLHFNGFPISAADSFLLDDRLLVGKDNAYLQDARSSIQQFIQKYTQKQIQVDLCSMDGHIDGNYHPIKPGAILSLYDVQNYEETFPGWDVCYLPDQSWALVKGWHKLKQHNRGKWWVSGEEDNREFINFVETWLKDWVGYVEETVFDVNVLVIDEHHVCVSQPNNTLVNNFFKKHGIEPVYVPWRHRYFWDGGLHCITLDLYREGKN